ncbi:hypothetical protein FFI94_014305 [Rhodococcus sp. KBS0724]|uniref:hypothetical protein n=1 Tax=Rhodococcus sp. KBS0724 TaxID=1179674 RepID=UPI00110F6842|nr:hypothetical protein [Rhodococcus sp. KBS0724]TSD47213.1 hypothetical protein FFI94_014305 [Rhodococcus sp. KBS0724]
MNRRSVPAVAGMAVVFAGFVLVACSPAENPHDVAGTEQTLNPRYFAEPPEDTPKDPSARCLDADMPNMSIDESVAYWQNIFDDQRSHYPEQSFPSQQEVERQKRSEWSDVVTDLVPPGGDAAFAQDVCGLPPLDGALYSGIPMREVRGHAAELGRRACTSIIEQGAAGLWQSLQAQESDRSDIAAYSYLIHSAIVHVCPQLSDLTAGPTGIVRCANVIPDPSARPGEGVFCVN